ncbi:MULTISPECIES: hypothetical protein [Citrobacter]|uniref:hypothetical protein n=1 Tax=Citrobacter TaxID=544 RepID=UPI0008FD2EEC|nr:MULTISPECIES: hypothetical protein [Citrobacter]ELD0979735.1 hypothetical protein [Citrobacter freundii]OIY17039.1 hypothetical protein BED45_19025 [Citrobacter freundii]HAZ3445220.1 hypothetical protein [Citrobacter freundii]HDR2892090.1 hypothetical protein [Enterobacter asburiae]
MTLKIIPFEYCSLERAAKFFDCEIDDFFHWYETKKISLCLKLSDRRATILSVNNESVEFKRSILADDIHFQNEYSFKNDDSEFIGDSGHFDQLGQVYRIKGYANDFWVPCDNAIETLRNKFGLVDRFAASPYNANRDFRIMIHVTEPRGRSASELSAGQFPLDFTVSDLVLHKTDLDIVNHIVAGIPYERAPASNDAELTTIGSTEVINEHDVMLDWGDFSGKDTSLKFIAGMALSLMKSSPKYRHGSRMNKDAIVKNAVANILEQGIEFDITERQLSGLITKALKAYSPKTTE